MAVTRFWRKAVLFLGTAVLLSACATGPQVVTVQEVSASADTPYRNILVVALFDSFDSRKYLETEVVRELSDLGTKAIASTTMMDSRTPINRQAVVAMVDKIGADAVLVTQLVSLDAEIKFKAANPELTRNIRPTYYYNVFTVELTEYVEPPSMEIDNSLKLGTQLFSVSSKEAVWTIESRSKIVQNADRLQDYSIYVSEAEAITEKMMSDRLISH